MTQPTDWKRLESLLDEFLDLPEGEFERRLEELGREHPEDARAIRNALDPEAKMPGVEHMGALIAAAGGDGEDQHAADYQHPSTIGPWEITELIASGGMGDVYRARRADGEFEATAALKRLRFHVTSQTAHDRFRRERQVLSDLSHPHIAGLLDGGVDTNGVPYFVMEFVDGRPITTHCDEARLSIDDRLSVFDQVTGAVAAAHRQLVVHRDLKPPNILVESDGTAKLVDFGIAKLLDTPPDINVTATHERVLTPRYAAPEQLLGGEITTATDVYGLGLVLYELLSGCRTTSDEEIRKAILVGNALPDPPRMSMALGRLQPADAEAIAEQRGTTRRRLIGEIRGDLDEIVAKSLRPDPADRYPTVYAMAADLRRARDSEPVEAHRGSWPYRMRKRWARHRVAATALSLIILSLATGLWIALVQARAARTAQHQAAAINRFLTEELLGAADPRIAKGRELTVREIVNRTSRDLSATVGDEPLVEASIRQTLGEVWTRLGSFSEAREELTLARELATGDPVATARLSTAFAELLYAEGKYPEARSEAEQAMEELQATTGPKSLDTIRARIRLGRMIDGDSDPIQAEIVLIEAVDLLDQHWPGEGAVKAEARLELASVLRHQGRRIEGLEHLRTAIELQRATIGSDHPDVARTLEKMAELLSFLDWHDEAEETARESLEICQSVYGPVHWRTSRAAFVLAKVLSYSNRTDEAFDIAETTLETVLPVFGPDHEETITLQNALAVFSERRGDSLRAVEYYRAALQGAERGLGPVHDTTMMIRRNFSDQLARIGFDDESVMLAREVADIGLKAAMADRPDPMYLAKISYFLSAAELEEARDLDTALALAQRAVEVSQGRWYYPWVTLADARYGLGDLDKAIEAQQRALSLPDGLHYERTERELVEMLMEKGDLEAAERFLRAHLRRRLEARGEDDPLIGHSMALLGRTFLAQERFLDARQELQNALAQYDRQLDKDHRWRIPLHSDLGAALMHLGSVDEASDSLELAFELATWPGRPPNGRELELIKRRLDEIEAAAEATLEVRPPGATGATHEP